MKAKYGLQRPDDFYDHIFKILTMDEGLVLSIYKDSLGYYTVGIGHLLTKSPSMDIAIQELDKLVGRSTNGFITEEEAQRILEDDVNKFLEDISNSKIIGPIFKKLDHIRQLGLFSMCFQMGIKGVESFKNSLKFIDMGMWDRAGINLRKSLWYRQTPNRADRVINMITIQNVFPYRLVI